MKKKAKSKTQILLFFTGFVLLFFLVFSLGVIVGKGFKGPGVIDYGFIQKENTGSSVKRNTGLLGESNLSESEEPELSPDDQKALKRANVNKVSKNYPNKSQEKKETSVKDQPEKIKKQDSGEKPDRYTAKLDYSIPDFPKTDPGGKFTVQVGSFKNPESAFNFEKKLSGKGYPSFVIKANIPNKGVWYRVRVGTFNDKEKAKKYAEKIKNKEQLEFTQVTINN